MTSIVHLCHELSPCCTLPIQFHVSNYIKFFKRTTVVLCFSLSLRCYLTLNRRHHSLFWNQYLSSTGHRSSLWNYFSLALCLFLHLSFSFCDLGPIFSQQMRASAPTTVHSSTALFKFSIFWVPLLSAWWSALGIVRWTSQGPYPWGLLVYWRKHLNSWYHVTNISIKRSSECWQRTQERD